MLIMLLMNLNLSILMLFLSHPLSMGMTLLTQTLMTALISSLISFNSIISYILFLVLIGGMMVLFIYMTSIASNEKFTFNPLIILIFIIPIILMMITKTYESSLLMIKMNMIEEMNSEIIVLFSKTTNKPSYTNSIFLFIYLLISMIAIIKITNINYGPLRHMH